MTRSYSTVPIFKIFTVHKYIPRENNCQVATMVFVRQLLRLFIVVRTIFSIMLCFNLIKYAWVPHTTIKFTFLSSSRFRLCTFHFRSFSLTLSSSRFWNGTYCSLDTSIITNRGVRQKS